LYHIVKILTWDHHVTGMTFGHISKVTLDTIVAFDITVIYFFFALLQLLPMMRG
jgi:hypothetical protein